MKLLPKLKYFLVFLAALVVSPLIFSAPVHAADLDCSDGSLNRQVIRDAATCNAINLLFTNSTTAGPWYDQNPNQFAAKVFGGSQDEIFGERYTYAQINWIINSIATMLNPALRLNNPSQLFDFINAIQKIKDLTRNGQTPSFADYAQIGPVGLFGSALSMVYSHPVASGVGDVKSAVAKVLDLGTGISPVKAQGYGFQGLTSGGAVRSLWTASRNMAYLIMVILLVAAGFLIMFRVKINPQTVVSLQTMIPKLIITMLLVTFSFAIAGLVIDLIYVVILAFVGFISLPGSGILGTPWNGFNLTTFVTQAGFPSYFVAQIITPFISALALTIVMGTLAVIPFTTGVGAPLLVITLILSLVLMVFFFIILIRILLMLLTSYVTLMLLTIVGPLQIMLDLIPGQQGFGPWIRNMIANASVFAVVPIMFILQHAISGDIASSAFGIQASGVTADIQLPFLFAHATQIQVGGWLLDWVVGLVILAMTPKIAQIIRDALKVPPFKYSNALSEVVGDTNRWYQGVIAGQRQREQDALTRSKLEFEGKPVQPFSAGLGGEIDRSRQRAGAQAPTTPPASETTRRTIEHG